MEDNKAVILVVTAGMILALLFSWIFGDKEEVAKPAPPQKQTDHEKTVNPQPDELEKERKEQEKKMEQDMKSIEAFLRDFLTKYLEYDPAKPTAHIESVKSYLAPHLYKDHLSIYQVPIDNWNDRKLANIKEIHISPLDYGSYEATADVTVEIITSNNEAWSTDMRFHFIIESAHSRWMISDLNFYNYGEE